MRPPTAEELASMLKASGLREKFIFTFLMIAIFRLGVHLPLYGIDNSVFASIAHGNNLINFIDLFSGGALSSKSAIIIMDVSGVFN